MCPLIKKKQKSILFESEREKHSRQKKVLESRERFLHR